jgi:hypothetical protein
VTGTWTLLPGVPVTPILTNDPEGMYRADNHAWLFGWSNGEGVTTSSCVALCSGWWQVHHGSCLLGVTPGNHAQLMMYTGLVAYQRLSINQHGYTVCAQMPCLWCFQTWDGPKATIQMRPLSTTPPPDPWLARIGARTILHTRQAFKQYLQVQ